MVQQPDDNQQFLRYCFYLFSKRKLTTEKNLLQPEPTLNRTAPPRPTSRTHTAPTVTPKLPDFTEDPFRDYRYEDPFNIVDPFADDTEDLNANKNETTTITTPTGKPDPFSYGTASTIPRKNSFSKGFETDFSNTFSLSNKNKVDKDNAKFDADFVKAFSDDNRNIKTIESDAFLNTKTKTINIDEAFSTKNERSGRRHGQDLAHNRSKASFNEKKTKGDVGKSWNGNNTPLTLSEEDQFVWASQQSLKTEEERRRRKQQEDAELALALELSKQEKSGKL